MSDEVPPKMNRDSLKPPQRTSQTTVQTGENEVNSEGVVGDLPVTPQQSTETEQQVGEKEVTPPGTSPGPKAALSMDQLMDVGAKKLPTSAEEIPEHLYKPGTKSYKVARLIIFDGITDNDELKQRANVSAKTIYNVKSAIRQVIEEVKGTRDIRQGTRGEIAGKGLQSVNTPSRDIAQGTREGNQGDAGTPIIPTTSEGDIGTHGNSRGTPPLPGTPQSPKSPPSQELPQNILENPGTIPESEIRMVGYPMADGTRFYFPARETDVQEHSAGRLSTNDLFARSGQIPPRDDDLERDHIVQVENAL